MKLMKCMVAASVLASLFSCATTKGISEDWTSPEGLQVTESVLFDGEEGCVYVSNINGKPTEENGLGFISLIDSEGIPVSLEWVAGLNAPKGMGIYEDRLYVTDINRIHVIDKSAASLIETIPVEGAKFLNDIVIDAEGRVIISDTGAHCLYILENGAVETWLELADFKKPNGLLLEGDDLMVGTAAGLVRVNRASKEAVLEIPLKGGIDGLKSVGDGTYVVSDWKSKIQLINAQAEPILLSDTAEEGMNAADFEYFEGNNALLVPTFFDNRVIYFSLD
ncbi:MAG: hypothetical protein PQJ60_06570 [Spirochaetales bacterium]|nr:hypothetical protein [Spirochaetales bacterium]